MTKFLATSCPNEVLSGFASSNEGNANTNFEESNFISPVYAGDVAYNVLSDSINTNSTQLNNSTVTVNMDSNGGENNFIMLLFAVLMMLMPNGRPWIPTKEPQHLFNKLILRW